MQNFSCSALLRCRLAISSGFRLRDFHPLRCAFPDTSANLFISLCWRSYNPGRCRNNTGLGSYAFARHYLRNHFCFLFLRVMRCFSSPGSPRALRGAAIACGGLPHSEIHGYNGYLPLAVAYRSLSRPSSPPRAKASFMCPSLLSFNGLVSPFIFAYSLLLEFRIFFAEFFAL